MLGSILGLSERILSGTTVICEDEEAASHAHALGVCELRIMQYRGRTGPAAHLVHPPCSASFQHLLTNDTHSS